jgi:hypothetical protein
VLIREIKLGFVQGDKIFPALALDRTQHIHWEEETKHFEIADVPQTNVFLTYNGRTFSQRSDGL